MRLRWEKKQLARAKGPMICIHAKLPRPAKFAKVGDECEVPDEVGYDLLKKHEGFLVEVKAPVKKLQKKKKTPAKNKMMAPEKIEDKANGVKI